ncbi:uncharacterized protein [Procambarus clarkii]|uniref:uncharacterized protein isoform X1 n=2 Tax=Procambarus clarkii TaxID=6728 RepID=UPI003744A5BA
MCVQVCAMVRLREEALALVLAVVREASTHPPPDLAWLIPSPPEPISNLDWPLKEVTWAKHSDIVKKLAQLTDYWSLSKRPPLPSALPKSTSEQALSTALLPSTSAPSTAPTNAKPLPLSDDPATNFIPSTLVPTLPAKATRSTAGMNSRISRNSSKPTIELRSSPNVRTQSTSSACVMSTRSKPTSTTAESPFPTTATGSRLSSTAIATGFQSSSNSIITRSRSSAAATATRPNPSPAATATRPNPSPAATETRPNPSPAATATRPNPWPTGCTSSSATTATGCNSSKRSNSSCCVDTLVTLVDILHLVSSQLELFYTVQHAHLQTLRYYVCHTFSPFLRQPLLSALDKAYEQLVPGVESCWSWCRCLTVAHAANPSIFLVQNLPPPPPTFTLTDDDDHHHFNGDKTAMKPPVGGHVTRKGVMRRVLAGKRRRQS